MGLNDNDKKLGEVSGETSDKGLNPPEDEEDVEDKKPELGPMIALKEQLEKDKDDVSLQRWKEQLLGSVDLQEVGENPDPAVEILNLIIKSADRGEDIVLTIPENGRPNPKGSWFTLKEGSKYTLLIIFRVTNNIVSGLRYNRQVWKTGIKVDNTKEMLGTFSPQTEPYNHTMPEDTTPSGMLARGSYTAKTKFTDDDDKCYLELNYTFEIRKTW